MKVQKLSRFSVVRSVILTPCLHARFLDEVAKNQSFLQSIKVQALKRGLVGLKEADKLTQTSNWDGARTQMLYVHAALRFCEGGKVEMDGVETLLQSRMLPKQPTPASRLVFLLQDLLLLQYSRA